MPQIDWKKGNTTNSAHPFIDFCKAANQVQTIDFSTRKESILDLVLTADSQLVTKIKEIAPPKSCDHCLIFFQMEISYQRQIIRSALDFKNANKKEIDREICFINWNQALNIYPNNSDLYKFFICFLHELMCRFKDPIKRSLWAAREFHLTS